MIEIRALKSASQKNMSPTRLASLLAEGEMACGLPCVVDGVVEAVRLLGLNGRECALLESAIAQGRMWKGQDRSGRVAGKSDKVCVRRALAEV